MKKLCSASSVSFQTHSDIVLYGAYKCFFLNTCKLLPKIRSFLISDKNKVSKILSFRNIFTVQNQISNGLLSSRFLYESNST